MKANCICFLSLFLLINTCFAQEIVGFRYPVDPAQQDHPDIPKGEILQFKFSGSKIFPGTIRDYWIYIPAQYKPDKPACLFVDMDGIQFNAPKVFDYLISKNEMPVTIGVFVSFGTVTSDGKDIRYNRGHELTA